MRVASVRAFLAAHAPDIAILTVEGSSATVVLAAAAFGVEPARIAKTLSLRVSADVLLVVMRGDARLDNAKVKAAFGAKPRFLDADEAQAQALTGHPVGGVCPIGLATPLPVYCDVSLQAFDSVLPAAGATNTALRIAPERLAGLTGATWVGLCRIARALGRRGAVLVSKIGIILAPSARWRAKGAFRLRLRGCAARRAGCRRC